MVKAITERYSRRNKSHYGKDHSVINDIPWAYRNPVLNGNQGRVIFEFDSYPRGKKSRWVRVDINDDDILDMAIASAGGRRALIDKLMQLEREEADNAIKAYAEARVDLDVAREELSSTRNRLDKKITQLSDLTEQLDEAKARITAYRISGG